MPQFCIHVSIMLNPGEDLNIFYKGNSRLQKQEKPKSSFQLFKSGRTRGQENLAELPAKRTVIPHNYVIMTLILLLAISSKMAIIICGHVINTVSLTYGGLIKISMALFF